MTNLIHSYKKALKMFQTITAAKNSIFIMTIDLVSREIHGPISIDRNLQNITTLDQYRNIEVKIELPGSLNLTEYYKLVGKIESILMSEIEIESVDDEGVLTFTNSSYETIRGMHDVIDQHRLFLMADFKVMTAENYFEAEYDDFAPLDRNDKRCKKSKALEFFVNQHYINSLTDDMEIETIAAAFAADIFIEEVIVPNTLEYLKELRNLCYKNSDINNYI